MRQAGPSSAPSPGSSPSPPPLRFSSPHLWPADLTNTTPTYVRISWAAFLILTFRFHIGLALLAVATFGGAVRSRRLLFITAPLLLITLAPALWTLRPRPVPPLHPGADTLTLMSANLLYSRVDAAALLREIDRADPDVILFQEYCPDASTTLLPTLAGRYPHRIEEPRDDAFGQAVYSKRPFAGPSRLDPIGPDWTQPQIKIVVALDARPLPITNIHLVPPANLAFVTEHRLQAARLADVVAADLAAHGAAVLAGDFNATPASPHLAALERAGLRESNDLAGRGRAPTWPRTSRLRFAPGIRLDHVFLSEALVCLDAHTCADIGSDHRPIIARVAWRHGPTDRPAK